MCGIGDVRVGMIGDLVDGYLCIVGEFVSIPSID